MLVRWLVRALLRCGRVAAHERVDGTLILSANRGGRFLHRTRRMEGAGKTVLARYLAWQLVVCGLCADSAVR